MSQNEGTSLSLLERLRDRDDDAWRRMLDLYRPLILFWSRRGGVADKDAEDIVQEVSAAVAASIEQFQRQRVGSFRTWMRGITQHKLMDYFRREGRQLAAAEGGSTAHRAIEETPGPVDDASEVGVLYRRALDFIRVHFEDKTWMAFWRTAVDNHPTDAVAADLGMTPVAVRVAKARVLARLREEMGDALA